MQKYLITTTETWRVNRESDVATFIEEAKESTDFELKKYTSEYKEAKAKGEVIDSWYKVTLVKSFNSEKEPETQIEVTYEVE